MTDLADLEEQLRALGRSITIEPPADDLEERVLDRVLTLDRVVTERPGPFTRAWHWLVQSRRRLVAMIIAAVIIALGLTPPVRATVLEWLRIGGVVIKTAPPAGTSTSQTPQPPPTSGPTMTVAEAQRLVDFPLSLPQGLGTPARVGVSDDRRVVSMDWGSDASGLHLDQFSGELSWVFVKRYWEDVTPTVVGGRDAVWLAKSHPIVYVDRQGTERTEQARIAGPALVWQRTVGGSEVTLRLEGNVRLARALAIAESVR
jgi:hypothetical protein